MFRYVALTWSTSCDAQNVAIDLMDKRMHADASRWSIVLDVPGIRVYCAGVRPSSSEVYPLDRIAGVVLGTVFRRIDEDGSVPCKATFGPAETATVVRTQGRELIDRYWGNYVAFLLSPNRGALVIRSPTGGLDCLSTSIQGVRLYFSGAQHCPLLELRRFSINWDYVAAEISTLVPETRETGLREIARVLHGECEVVRDDGIQRLSYWHPFNCVKEEPVEDVTNAAEALRRTSRACVQAWASCYESALTMLSGGLDSSIVVNLLREAPTRPMIVCVNYRNPYDTFSDERRYARLVAQQVGYPLIEREQDARFSMEPILQLPKTASPWLSVYEMGETRHRTELARKHRAGAYILGHGGDQVFFQGAAEYMCADDIHQRGLGLRAISIALKAARMGRGALWPVLGKGIRDGLRADPLTVVMNAYEFSPLLEPEVMQSVRRKQIYIPPWFERADRLPPGKCWQVISLSVPEAMHSLYAPEGDPEIVCPLLSQPLQELCLRIPTPVLAFDGRERGLARFAFKEYLPPEILRRQAKGAISEYVKVIWMSNLQFVRDLLLDGVLVKQGIVDRRLLEKTLASDFTKGLGYGSHVTNLIGAEAWLRNWTHSQTRIAA